MPLKKNVYSVFQRACHAWTRYQIHHGYSQHQQPSYDLSHDFWTSDGRQFYVLVNVNGILSVYRIRPDSTLRKLSRIPKEILQSDKELDYATV
jgi:hypothetical protein